MRTHWDIFCNVIDNFGDIATCWRLAKLLTKEHHQAVRLWVDDLATMQKLVPGIEPKRFLQHIDGIEVGLWQTDFPAVQPAPVVIEAFACNLPESYVAAMRQVRSVWVNLEYFSAEDWVAGCHGLPSTLRDGQVKYFFFPSLLPGTGGLMRERDLLLRRDTFLGDPEVRRLWCQTWRIPWPKPEGLSLSLFTYEHPALPDMLGALSHAPLPVTLYVPAGRSLTSVRKAFPNQSLEVGATLQAGALTLHVIPFLPQEEYDFLLWLCDINFVRGEESLSRAIWAGKPFIWHVYPTEDGAHLAKLEAFLRAYAGPDVAESFAWLMRAWNAGGLNLDDKVPDWWAHLAALHAQAPAFALRSMQLAQQEDLATQLVKFVASHYNVKVLQPLSSSDSAL